MALLPVLSPIKGEALHSYLNRTAQFHCGISLKTFLDLIQLSSEHARFPKPSTLDRVSKLTGQPREVLEAMAFVNVGKTKCSIRGEIVNLKFRDIRVRRHCPACILEDMRAAQSGGPAPYGRLEWQIKAVRVCGRHNIVLQENKTQAPNEATDILTYFGIDKTMLEASILKGKTQTPSRLQRYILARLSGERGPSWLDQQPLHMVSTACGLIGASVDIKRNLILSQMKDARRAQLDDVGFEFASRGVGGVRDALKLAYGRCDVGRDGHGPNKVFGRLYVFFTDPTNSRENPYLRDVVREFVLDNFPIESGFALFGEQVPDQRYHSVFTLSKKTKISIPTIRFAAEAAGLIPADDDRGLVHSVFDFAAGEALGEQVLKAGPSMPLLAYLKCNHDKDQSIIAACDVPRRKKQTSDACRIGPKVDVVDLDRFLSDLIRKISTGDHSALGLVDITGVSRLACLPAIDIIRGVLFGDLNVREANEMAVNFDPVLIDPVALQTAVSGVKVTGFLWKKDAAKVMGLEVRALTKLMEMNDQTGDPYFTQHYGGSAYEERAPILDVAEIHAFNEAHLTLNEYASLSGGIYKARCHLRRMGTKPIAPKSILLRYVYRKSDIQTLPV